MSSYLLPSSHSLIRNTSISTGIPAVSLARVLTKRLYARSRILHIRCFHERAFSRKSPLIQRRNSSSLTYSNTLFKQAIFPKRGLMTSMMSDKLKDGLLDSPLSEPDNGLETPPEIKGNPSLASAVAQEVGMESQVTVDSQLAADSQAAVEEAVHSDPEGDIPEEEEVGAEEVQEALSRPPAVNSGYLPLPWKGRLGYACLNTYLRTANPPVFSSRTCRINSILEHRHPLLDPAQPEHATKNRPDLTQPSDVARGMAWVHSLGLANARDIVKMLRWNNKYGIKFMRLSSEMFPFASHAEYGYKLEPFAADTLAEAGKVAAELGHRLTTHPGQFTQLGSPREQVVVSAIRDLEYHAEMLRLLKLPEQQDRDAVIILHMGGVFGDKGKTLDRFRKNYATLPQDIKNRVVLENDDVSWTVHDLLPICEELNIPLVLDYHHHNINFDADKIREGTLDIVQLYDRIKATWTRKGIKQKMHYSEPTPSAITRVERRRHSPRVQILPPCDPDMDLMIEAKDKEQAVFELMRTYKLPGFEKLNEVIPYVREDENKPPPKIRKKKAAEEEEQPAPPSIPDDEVSMGGPNNRVYWPLGMEHYLKPQKRVVAAKKLTRKQTAKLAAGEENLEVETPTPAKRMRGKKAKTDPDEEQAGEPEEGTPTPAKRTPRRRAKKTAVEDAALLVNEVGEEMPTPSPTPKKRAAPKRRAKKKEVVETASSDAGEPTTAPESQDEYVPAKKRTKRSKRA